MLCSLIYSALLHKIYSALYQIPVSSPHSQTDIQYTNRIHMQQLQHMQYAVFITKTLTEKCTVMLLTLTLG